MILNLAYTIKDLFTSNQVKFRPIHLLTDFNTTNLDIRGLYYLFDTLTFTQSIVRLVTLIKLISI